MSPAAMSKQSVPPTVTIERIKNAIKMTARCMVSHDLGPQLMPTLKRLEAERDRLMRDGDAIEYAKRVLAASCAEPFPVRHELMPLL
jgi:hypothetical protein